MLSVTEKLTHLADRPHGIHPQALYAASVAVDAAATDVCAGLTEDQLCWSPRPGAWSICQNLAHLRATNEVFLPAVDAALETSRKRNLQSAGPFSLNLYGRVMVWRMESRPIIKMQAPKAVRPQPSDSPASALQNFLTSQAGPSPTYRVCRGSASHRAPFSFAPRMLFPLQPARILLHQQRSCPASSPAGRQRTSRTPLTRKLVRRCPKQDKT